MSKKIEIALPDIAATEKLARHIAAMTQEHDVITLSGELGAGKTTFARAFIGSLTGKDEEVTSPTFNLVKIYNGNNGLTIWHFDLYRIKNSEELYELGIEDALNSSIVIMEWPEAAENFLPADRLNIKINYLPEKGKRKALISTISEKWQKINEYK